MKILLFLQLLSVSLGMPPPQNSPMSSPQQDSQLFPQFLQNLFNGNDNPPPYSDYGLTPADVDALKKVKRSPPMQSSEEQREKTRKNVGDATQTVLNKTLTTLNDPGLQQQNKRSWTSTKAPWDSNAYYSKKDDSDMADSYYDSSKLHQQKNSSTALGVGLGIGLPALIVVCFIICVIVYRGCCRRPRTNFPLPVPKLSNAYAKYEHSPALSSADPWEMNRMNLNVDYETKLGSGAFCNVFKGKVIGEAPVCQMLPSLRSSAFRDCVVAIKMLPSFADDIARSDFMQEINFMKSLQYHPNLVSMLGWVADRKSPLLLVEFCAHGDLLHYIRARRTDIMQGMDNPSGLRIKEIVSFAWQISNGLEYLNSVGCIHRDIAARNVLVADNNVCKIGDFGLCRLTDSLLYTARGGRLPLKWMAPESLSLFEYSFKSDVWSYGVLLWELLSLGEVPFAGVQTTELLDYIKAGNRLPRPDFCTNELYDVMTACWNYDSAKRPSFTLICQTFAKVLETATENYGYLVPTHRESQIQCDNV